MKILGIESTAHTFGLGIVDEHCNILLDEKNVYTPPKGSGIIPSEAAASHKIAATKLLENTPDFDVLAYSMGPGLPPSLKVGWETAQEIHKRTGKPLVGVNHSVAHIEIGRATTSAKDPVVVYVSGGNTQIIALTGGRYRIFGETLDNPIGNAFDVLARSLGLKDARALEALADKGTKLLELPYLVKGMDLSFSGIVTHCQRLHERPEDIAHSFREYVFSMLCEVTERALSATGKKEVLVVGGVAASPRLRTMMEQMTRERGARTYIVPFALSGDNGVMIAWTGWLMHKSGMHPTGIDPRQRTDEIEVKWE